uniref:Protein-PII uridylyltransferase N-terminal domain-containing protein n=1 Tax=Branchiostoma floridae TaxID=7739 RepID=C3YTE8_BRAFL|eukprot:XP_002600503.1 hypothetical protein BRAFLDRAFT_70126 [Branchiostoma floridae]
MAAVYEQAQSVTNPRCIFEGNGTAGPSVRFYTGRRSDGLREETHRLARTPLKGLDKHGGEGCISEDAYEEPEPIRLQWQEDGGRRQTGGRIISDPPDSDSVYTEPQAILPGSHVSQGCGQASAATPGAGEEEQTPEGSQRRPGETHGSHLSSGYQKGKMDDTNMNSLVKKLQDLELCLQCQHGQEVGYGRALREAILDKDSFIEVEVLKCLGDLRLKKAKLSKDSAEFDKAAALYAAALLHCTDPDMGETLEHRIGYMEKLSRQLLQGYSPHFRWLLPDYWGTANSNVVRVAEIGIKLDRTVGKPWHSVEETYTETLVTAIANSDMFLELEILKSLGDLYLQKGKAISGVSQFPKAAAMQYKDHLKEGESSLARADLDSAEQHFAAALKMVHAVDLTAQLYQREVEPLCKLGDVYSRRGQQIGDGGDFVKAAALYNAAIARSEDQILKGNIETAIKEVEKAFLKCILDINSIVSQDDTEQHKKQLKKMRDQIKLEMETIDQQLDPYVHDEDDPCVKEIEAKRAQAVRHLFERIAQQRKEFISLLVEECIGLMGPPPCKYALIGLGSQATGLVTPYSDLEFAILVEEENEECLEYFRKLTDYLHLKVVNLGETILPALGIKSLNDFYSKNPLDSWYYDSVTPRGFAFDGSMPKASKTPLGRQGTLNEPPSHLICTPSNMASKLQNDATLYLKEGYHLAAVLRNPCLITGDQDLTDTYMAITVKILQVDSGKMAQQLAQEMLRENFERFSNEETITARLTNVKNDIYRFPAVAVDCLALKSQIVPTTVWKTIEDMANQGVISPNNAHHLTVLTSISAELRLRTYIANGGQRENLSALASMEKTPHESSTQKDDVKTSASVPVFHVPNDKQLFRYYYTAVPLKNVLHEWSEKKPALTLISDFHENSARVQGIMYSKLCQYEQALRCYHEALQKTDGTDIMEKSTLLKDIGHAYNGVGDYPKAISFCEQALQMDRSIYGPTTAHPDIATSLNNLGSAWSNLGNDRQAISYHEEALQMYRSIYGPTTAHPDIANSLNNLGAAWSRLGNNRQAISYHEEALQMYRSIYGPTTAHPDIATSLNNLGSAWSRLGNNRQAISYYEEALQMYRSIYGPTTAHPDIATSLNNLGSAWSRLGNNRQAISYHEQALQMHRSIYGPTTAHPDIANSLNNLGAAWSSLGNIDRQSATTKRHCRCTGVSMVRLQHILTLLPH